MADEHDDDTMDGVHTDPTDHFIQSMFDKDRQDKLRLPDPDDCTGSGWYWYCDEHTTHGNAESKDEAKAILAAHVAYQRDAIHDICEGLYVIEVDAARTYYINKGLGL